ncbi:MAG: PEP-CTERM sorting domain-containing protein [Pseudomonadota bacterium]
MKPFNRLFKAVVAVAVAGMTGLATAEVVTFETHSGVRHLLSGDTTYVEGSFEIAAVSPPGQLNHGAEAFTWNLPNGTGIIANQYLRVSARDGGLFRFDSLDLLRATTERDFSSVTFIGVLADNSHVTRHFVNRLSSPFLQPGTSGIFHYHLDADFSALRSLMVSGNQSHVIDNIAVTPVPEPETYALMLAGLAVMGGVAARRRKSGDRV